MILPPLEAKPVEPVDVRTEGDRRAEDDRSLRSAETETVTLTVEALAALLSSAMVTGAAAPATDSGDPDEAVSAYARAKLPNVPTRRPDGCVRHVVDSFRLANPDRALWVGYVRWVTRGAL